MPFSSADMGDLRQAKALLENPGLVARISDVLGTPLERGFGMLPKKWGTVINEAASKAIAKAMDVALSTMNSLPASHSSNGWHKLAVGASGAVGGAFGLSTLLIELPVSTTIMLRSIADVARSEGEDLSTPESQLACVQVLALGGRSAQDDAAETGYFAARAAMAQAVSEAARQVAQKGLVQRKGTALVQLIAQVASRFSVNVSEKVMAQAVPIVGAVGGAVINTLFMEHFQCMARGHFIVRRLERVHGVEEVRVAYAGITVNGSDQTR
ncbi:MAG: EcsC family protein [Aquabacterium sp.]|uniref:EcsC family protein n=1 Tax=Aquabacterium sp. TaxID=1872578 RepID=UPI00271CBD06|nr:EcsC family protein [Aquabacterium sp.]MDO9004491.1 EcsC family protein [Aquabacterium sp.]